MESNPDREFDDPPAWRPVAGLASAHAGLGLVVLSTDEALLATLEGVVPAGQRLDMVSAETELATALMESHVGVALIDAACVSAPLAEVTLRLRAQFPDLVLVVAGGPADQAAVTSQVTSGTIYRFLHKPVSEQRVRLFVEAALRRHDQDQAFSATASPAGSGRPAGRLGPGTSTARRGLRQFTVAAAVAALVAVAALAGWLLSSNRAPSGPVSSAASAPQRGSEVDARLAAARSALARGELIAPRGGSAADLYREILAHNPDNAEARDGLGRVIDQLCSLAEREITGGRLEQAARYVESARGLDPQHVRVSFLTTEIAKERERSLIVTAREAAASGNVERALAVLSSGGDSPLVSEARRGLEQQKVTERVRSLLQAAAERVASGALIEPARNNARFFIESARALAPADPAVREAGRELNQRLLAAARTATAAADFGAAERWLQSAEESGAPRTDVAQIRRELQHSQSTARADNITQLSRLFSERITQNRLLEPASDSARYYYNALSQADASHPATQAARVALVGRTLEEARAALARSDLPGADRWISEASAAGADPADLDPVRRDLEAARQRAAGARQVLPASALQRVKYVEPRYPATAREQNRSGWVDVEFTVRRDGTVADVHALRAEPKGVFEQAAVDAIASWRFRPVLRDGVAIEQLAALRVRFALQQ